MEMTASERVEDFRPQRSATRSTRNGPITQRKRAVPTSEAGF